MRIQGSSNLSNPLLAASLGNLSNSQQLQRRNRASEYFISQHGRSSYSNSTASAPHNIFEPASSPRNATGGFSSNNLIQNASPTELYSVSFSGGIQHTPAWLTQQIEQRRHQQQEQQQQQHAFHDQNSQIIGNAGDPTLNTYSYSQSTSSAPPQPLPSEVQVPHTTQLLRQQQSEAFGFTRNGIHSNQYYNNQQQNQQQQEITSLNQFDNNIALNTTALTSPAQNTAYDRQSFDSQQVPFGEASPSTVYRQKPASMGHNSYSSHAFYYSKKYPYRGSASTSAHSTAPDMTSYFQNYHHRRTSSGVSLDCRSQDNVETEEHGSDRALVNVASPAQQRQQQPHESETATQDTTAGIYEPDVFAMEEVFDHNRATGSFTAATATLAATATSSSNDIRQPWAYYSVNPHSTTLHAIRNSSSISCPAAPIASSTSNDSISISKSNTNVGVAPKQQQESVDPSTPLPLQSTLHYVRKDFFKRA
ncbi:hypothetical protein BDB00DRAFT_786961 [Zychaea mexicana]|uniref:uncharacterized protein n=1 Tax=Zychaea mexicana TaxID=64656 RepID=UPI0022FECCCE|nr:uncharacterized protein BDB00DRAFT_786961 [Zychaea mexicana]KAI9494591.1 hypothetical protein BDB00DRAFT_786961 [Zychaea mexicana]